MRRWLFPLAVLATVLLAALLVWLWRTDAVLVHKCASAGGTWDGEARICNVGTLTVPASPASRSR
ncbi:hypothetical protein [Sphingomonas xinjiangensis]|uniref:Uncharacterized protein n=1 Tax=Sphingomonas xinjiangensis TaxID=643568 RepID=A0A840YDH9_9SPHN|nr:hypothetical protein [Sphingomonas xinjiangensis]MBB5711457.1 hypothetical protein [Sphingomonas xinjiangensis]